jgi:hypothetical protein
VVFVDDVVAEAQVEERGEAGAAAEARPPSTLRPPPPTASLSSAEMKPSRSGAATK